MIFFPKMEALVVDEELITLSREERFEDE